MKIIFTPKLSFYYFSVRGTYRVKRFSPFIGWGRGDYNLMVRIPGCQPENMGSSPIKPASLGASI